jgi:type I restriction enzyme S subunit
MNKENKLVPKLRFPEFVNSANWGKRYFYEFVTERTQYPLAKLPLFSLTIEDGITPKTERYERSFLVNNEEDAYKEVLPNDFAYNPMNLRFGAIARHTGNARVSLSKYYNIFYCDDSVDSVFCEMFFRSERMIKFYDSVSTGSLIEKKRVHFSDFLKFNFPIPSISEQKKIASCLSSLDELINAHTQKLDALKDHKKGLMQQLFPAEGETVPKLRFKEFEGDGEWVEKNKSVKIVSGVSYQMSEYVQEGIRLVQGVNIGIGSYNVENPIYINPETENQRHIIVSKGDILLGLNRPITNDELKVCYYPFESGYLYQRAGILKCNVDIYPDFLYQLLRSPLFLERLKKELVGSDQPYIKSNLF